MKKEDFASIIDKIKNTDSESLKESADIFFEKIKNDNSFQKKGGICLAIIAALLIGTHVVDAYQQQTIKVASEKQAKYEEIQKYLKKHNNDTMEYKDDLSQVKGKILDETEVDKANAVIIKLAEANGVSVSNNKKGAKAENIGNNIFSQKVSIDLTGEYGNILKFVNALENESFFTACETFSLSSARASAGNPNSVTAKIDYKVFFVKSKPDTSKESSNDKKSSKSKTTTTKDSSKTSEAGKNK